MPGNYLKRLSYFVFVLIIFAVSGLFPKPKSNFVKSHAAPTTIKIATSEARVIRVIDGDTIEIEPFGSAQGKQKVRYIGIDTPETVHPRKPVQCFGHEASAKNKELVEGKIVRLEKDVSETDRYGRLLRFIYLPSTDSNNSLQASLGQVATGSAEIFVNDYLARQGYARATTFPPDVKFAEQFRQAEQEARENNRGLWNNCSH